MAMSLRKQEQEWCLPAYLAASVKNPDIHLNHLTIILGIPLVGVWMAGIGSFIMVQSRKMRRRVSNDKKTRRKILYGQALFILFFGCLVFIFLPSVLFDFMEGWNYLESMYCKL